MNESQFEKSLKEIKDQYQIAENNLNELISQNTVLKETL